MSDRQRTTWQNGGDKVANSSQPVLPVERARAASAHPATPDEGAAHPAHKPDPTQPADYENGDTSSWAEDPTTGPYPNSAHPATPDEGSAHPAHKQTEMGGSVGEDQVTNEDMGVSKAAARELRAQVERKASKCIRIASALLGENATVASIEDQALDLMDLPDAAIQSTLGRLAAAVSVTAADESDEEACGVDKEASDDALLRQLLAEEEEAEEEKKEASEKSATDQILAAIQGLGDRITAIENGAPKAADDKTAMDDDDAMLAALLEEEAMVEESVAMEEEADDDVEAMLYSMLEEEPVEVEEEAMLEGEPVEVEEGELGIDMGAVEDPMGMLGDVAFDDGEEELLASLFADSRMAGDDSDEEEEEEEEEDSDDSEDEDEGKEAKKASRKPRPKKASKGARRLGGVSKSAASEIAELEKLWPSAPDVSGVFG